MKFKILNTEPNQFSSKSRQYLEEKLGVDNIECKRQDVIARISDYHGLLVCIETILDEEILSLSRDLKFIATPTTGLTHIDLAYAEQKNIHVISLRGEIEFLKNISSTAEHAWMLLLACARNIRFQLTKTKNYDWDRYSNMGTQLRGKTLGIIGMGRLGQKLVQYANSFQMNVLFYDPIVANNEGAKFINFYDLLKRSDFVILSANFTDDNRNLIAKDAFKCMKPNSSLINIARGELIDSDALIEALEDGTIRCAAVDVIEDENFIFQEKFQKSKILNFAATNQNLIVTPHVGGVTAEAREMTNQFIIEKIECYLSNIKLMK